MKLAIKLIAIVLVVSTMYSCDSFLAEQPYSFASGSTLFSNQANAELALTGVYDILNTQNVQGTGNHPMWGRGMHYLTNMGCDELIGSLNDMSDAQGKMMLNYGYNSESQYVSDAWFALYAGIDRANNILKYVPTIAVMDSARRVQMLAEAHYFRGFYYSYLAWLFGGVPLQLEPNSNAYAPRDSLSTVYKQIITDLTYATQNLPTRNVITGRVNRYTAQTMLAKVYLTLASCKENQVGKDLDNPLNQFDFVNQADCYQKCLTLCDSVYHNSGYSLHPNYNYLFIADTKQLKAEILKEDIMMVNAGSGGSSEYLLFSALSGPQGGVNTNGGNYGNLRPLGELAERYDLTNDARAIQNISGNSSSTLTQTILTIKYYSTNAVNTAGNNYCLDKFRQSDPAIRSALGIPTWASTLSFPLLRFADVILMYAEASYKLSGNATYARQLLLELRTRAAQLDATKAYILTQNYYRADFMQELSDERSRELCAEGWRRFDLIRWGKLTSVVANLNTTNVNNIKPNYYYWNTLYAAVIQGNYAPYKIWFPIPKRELETNPNLVPNFGY